MSASVGSNGVASSAADAAAGQLVRLRARMAGGFYLMVIIAGSVALFLRSGLVVRGDAAATATNILAAEPLFRLGVAAELIASACYIVVVALLYGLLLPVSRSISFVAACIGLAGCIVGAVLQVTFLTTLLLLRGAPDLAALDPDQLQAIALISLKLGEHGTSISFFFFGTYCLLLGYLVLRSTFLPRILGALLAIAGLAWVTGSLTMILSPPLAVTLFPYAIPVGGFGEAAFTLWLLVMGLNASRWQDQARGRP